MRPSASFKLRFMALMRSRAVGGVSLNLRLKVAVLMQDCARSRAVHVCVGSRAGVCSLVVSACVVTLLPRATLGCSMHREAAHAPSSCQPEVSLQTLQKDDG